jgi:hypothetical protein
MAGAGDVGVCILQTDGKSPLLVASLKGHLKVVRALVEAGADVGQATVSEGVQRMALMACSVWGVGWAFA